MQNRHAESVPWVYLEWNSRFESHHDFFIVNETNQWLSQVTRTQNSHPVQITKAAINSDSDTPMVIRAHAPGSISVAMSEAPRMESTFPRGWSSLTARYGDQEAALATPGTNLAMQMAE